MQFMAEMFMNCSNLVVEGNEKMKYTDGKNIMVYAQSADGAPVGARQSARQQSLRKQQERKSSQSYSGKIPIQSL